jgi:hypothetical protein
MATQPNPATLAPTPEDSLRELEFPQREAAFFYGLFLRGHSPEQLRRDIEVTQRDSRSCAFCLSAWSNTDGTYWRFSTRLLALTQERSDYSNLA